MNAQLNSVAPIGKTYRKPGNAGTKSFRFVVLSAAILSILAVLILLLQSSQNSIVSRKPLSTGFVATDFVGSWLGLHEWTYQGSAGQDLTIRIIDSDGCNPRIRLIDPDGELISSFKQRHDNIILTDTVIAISLSKSGEYVIQVTTLGKGWYTIRVN